MKGACLALLSSALALLFDTADDGRMLKRVSAEACASAFSCLRFVYQFVRLMRGRSAATHPTERVDVSKASSCVSEMWTVSKASPRVLEMWTILLRAAGENTLLRAAGENDLLPQLLFSAVLSFREWLFADNPRLKREGDFGHAEGVCVPQRSGAVTCERSS